MLVHDLCYRHLYLPMTELIPKIAAKLAWNRGRLSVEQVPLVAADTIRDTERVINSPRGTMLMIMMMPIVQ